MPIYEFKCQSCGFIYDVFCNMSQKEEKVKKTKCEQCKSLEKEELVAAPFFKFSNPVGTDRWNSESKGHDYRHNFNMDRKGGVRDQRKFAEENSHVGANPYNHIDDISSGKHFGEVK
jgi:putative FmdB family regulatory protein